MTEARRLRKIRKQLLKRIEIELEGHNLDQFTTQLVAEDARTYERLVQLDLAARENDYNASNAA